jgi:mycothiol synthase
MATPSDQHGTVELSETPAIPELTFRRFRGDEDFAKMVEVINSTKATDGIDRSPTVETIRNFYRLRTNWDSSRDILYAEVDEMLVGYDAMLWDVNGQDQRLYWQVGFVRPEWRRRGIGRALLRYGERRLREIAAGQPDDGTKLFEAEAADTQIGKEALLRNEGYSPARHAYTMLRDLTEALPEAAPPDQIELRPVTPQHYEPIRLAANEAFRDSWSDVPDDEEQFKRWIEAPDFRPELWVAAWDGDQIAGVVLNTIHAAENREYDRRRGWLYTVCTRRPWRGRGLARALLAESMRRFAADGMTEAALMVDTENVTGALRLYESVGFRPIKRTIVYRKPLDP